MTPEAFRQLVDATGISLQSFADLIGREFRLVRRWYSGRNRIPDHLDGPIRDVFAAIERFPQPPGDDGVGLKDSDT